ncbi:hypothetical protein T03_5485 [Trichinella britovi]|uniref:Uncharacterized protein n=1 Tax=Trichinella britovi TaxID=45882 RepID=A0A0V0YT17_TRIBR|nr:hypothetical protein T03_5485 [Trichinella britovi]
MYAFPTIPTLENTAIRFQFFYIMDIAYLFI